MLPIIIIILAHAIYLLIPLFQGCKLCGPPGVISVLILSSHGSFEGMQDW